MWVAVGNIDASHQIAYSYDGIIWNISSSSFNNRGRGVASANVVSGSDITLNAGEQLDVVCDSYYNTGFTNCSISIDA